jgi:hypothetical protein
VNSRRAPQRILLGQAPNEIATRRIDAWSSRTSRAAPPTANELSAVPPVDSRRLNQHQRVAPPGPHSSQDQPQQTVRRSKAPIQTCADGQLVLQGEDLKQEVSTLDSANLIAARVRVTCRIARRTATDYTNVDSLARRDIGDGQPPHERLGTHNRQELAPFDESREEDEGDSRWVVRPARSDPAFDVTRKLFSEEKILGYQLRSRSEHRRSRRNRSARRVSAVRSTSGDDTVWSESPRGHLQAGEWRALVLRSTPIKRRRPHATP